MSGTILSTPAVGSADWSGWITQQGATDTGYMRVSLTNFSSTAASLIGTGSVLECAGSIYTFSDADAIPLEDGTASADVAVYYVAVPSTDTTITCYMEGTAPTWVDSKQGFYQSAASLTRYVGGCYIATAATYYNKYLYTGENLVYCLQAGETRPLLKKVIDIGEWNMNATASLNVAHNIIGTRIRNMYANIKMDTDGDRYPIWHGAGSAAVAGSMINEAITGNIKLWRFAGGLFDSALFNATASTVANRGWIYIQYVA